jgi:lipid II:glycine glycyltransferase (peptidoglycan interpeptide bridge formation enzyme)
VVARVAHEVGPLRVESVSDPHRWNDLIVRLPDYALEQGFEWGEILKESGFEPRRYAVFEADECLAAATIFTWRLPMLRCAVLYAPRGPMIRADAGAPLRALEKTIGETARATRAVFLRVSPGAAACRHDLHAHLTDVGFVRLPEDWTIWNAPRIVMTLSLQASHEATWRRVSNSRRREIRRARTHGVTVVEATGAADLGVLYRLLLDMGRRKDYPVRRRRHFEAVWREYRASGAGILLLARHHGEIVGAFLGAMLGRRAYYLYSAVVRGRQAGGGDVHAGALLHWHFIQWASANGCEVIHWGGSGTQLPPAPSDPGYGVHQFKRSFGSECVGYLGYYDRVFRPGHYRLFRAGERRFGSVAWKVRARMNR